MKDFLFKKYSHFILFTWAFLFILFWAQFLTETNLFSATILTLGLTTPATIISTLLTTLHLPKVMRGNKFSRFLTPFILYTCLLALCIALVFQGYRYLMIEGWVICLPNYLKPTSLLTEFISALPSCIIINFGFCGLRFYYEHSRLQKEHLTAQLKILQQQINPHFMFNVLNHIHILMQKDVTIASDLLIKYSDILRYQLYQGEKGSILLEQEIQFLKDYIDVEQIRWGNEITVMTSWTTDNNKLLFPPLLLITLIENAFKHVSRLRTQKGYINIEFAQTKKTITLTVENSKTEKSVRKNEAKGIGLANMSRRLDILFANNYTLLIDDTDSVYKSKLTINLE